MENSDKTRKLDIIYLSPIDWDYNCQRPQQLASRLAKQCNILYIEPIGLRSFRVRDIPRVIRRIVKWVTKNKKKQNNKLHIYTPLYLPFLSSYICKKINGMIFTTAIKKLCRRLSFNEPVIWITLPTDTAVTLANKLSSRLLIYDCIDEYASFQKNGNYIRSTEIEILKKSSLVFATSNQLFERMKKTNPNTYLIPNACDFSHFAQIKNNDISIPSDINNIKPPIIGYIGAVSSCFDLELIEFVARSNTNLSIVIIGETHVDKSILPVADNIHYLGQKKYTELPNYMKAFDVGIIPFKVNDLADTINPVKLFEYLAGGMPVVSTDLAEVRTHENVVSIAKTKEEFLTLLKKSVEDNSVDKIETRLKVARENTWDKRVETILRLIKKRIGD